MRLQFTKMQGAGNDFIVLDATRAPIALEASQWRWLADRRLGVGADQILIVGPSFDRSLADFSYRIFNADGGEVEQCGNGARAFARFVRDKGLSDRDAIRVSTVSGVITPMLEPGGRITVDMGPPRLDPLDVPFDVHGLEARVEGQAPLWTVEVDGEAIELGVVSMGNPHAVLIVPSVDDAPVATLGPKLETHPRFPSRVNVGFVEVVDRTTARLRVFERGTGETLACGTGACAAVVSGIERGLLASPVTVHARGGTLVIAWDGGDAPVAMTGPAVAVFEGTVDVPQVDELPDALRDRDATASSHPIHDQAS